MRPSLRDNTLLDGGATSKARFPLAPEHLKTVLMRTALPTRIPVVCECGAPVPDRLSEDDHDSLSDSASGLVVHQTARRGWVNPSEKERLVDVNVAETGDNSLVKQDRFHRRSATHQNPLKVRDAKVVIRIGFLGEGFWPHAAQQVRERRGVWRKGQSAELSLVCVRDRASVVHRKPRAMVGRCWRTRLDDHKAPGHPEVDDERPVAVEVQQQILPSPSDADASRPGKRLVEWMPVDLGVTPGPFEHHVRKRPANDERFEGAPDGLDFGQLGHAQIVPGNG